MMQTVFVDINLKCVQLQQTGLKKKKELRHLENSQFRVWLSDFWYSVLSQPWNSYQDKSQFIK